MLQEGSYDVLEFSMPPQGMNQNISPEELPPSFAYVLENIVARPLGEGQVRFGTAEVFSLPQADATILKLFPFTKAGGGEQLLLYAQGYAHDATANMFAIQSPRQFSFASPHNAARYVKDTSIRVDYALNGRMTLYDTIADLTVAEGTVTVTLDQNILPPEAEVLGVSFSTGTLYAYDLPSKTLSAPLRQNLCVACIPRCATFMGKLVICNGVDRVLSWDGELLEEVYDFVKEEAVSLNRIDNRRFSFAVSPSFEVENYAVGNLLNIVVNGATTETAIVACAVNGQTVTVTTTTELPVFREGHTALFYQAWPPTFSFLFVAHDRLWALGEGAAGLDYRSPGEALRVYYTYRTNTATGWFHVGTKTVPSLDLSSKHGIPDNLEAICLMGDYIAFMGRKRTQVFQGQNPLPLNEGGDFAFNAVLPIGVVHGDLVVDLPNDVFFISSSGLLSFSTLNVAKQFAVTSFDAVDPKIQQDVTSLMASNAHYRAACSFKYEGGPLAGFKIGQNKVLCSLFSTTLYSWGLFSGDFEKASAYLAHANCLYLAIGNRVYRYADGQDGNPPLYGDQRGRQLIPFSWTLPAMQLRGKRYANKRYEIQMDYPSGFTVNEDNQVSIGISGNLPKSYRMESPCRFEMRGDALQTVPLASLEDPREGSSGFRLDQPFGVFKDRFKFMASKFWLNLSGYTQDGPVTIKKIKLYGIIER